MADLGAVHAQLGRESTDPAARPFLELLWACLAHRYGTEVAIGEDATIIGRADDIALGGSA